MGVLLLVLLISAVIYWFLRGFWKGMLLADDPAAPPFKPGPGESRKGPLRFPHSGKHLVIESYRPNSVLRLVHGIPSPSGGRVKLLLVWVDVEYSIENGEPVIWALQLAQRGTTISGEEPLNVASERTGQAWYSRDVAGKYLREVVERDMEPLNSGLRRMMFGKWRAEKGVSFLPEVVKALNNHESADRIERLLVKAGLGGEIAFTYVKSDGTSEECHARIQGVSGESLRAIDHRDRRTKSFRIARMNDVRAAL